MSQPQFRAPITSLNNLPHDGTCKVLVGELDAYISALPGTDPSRTAITRIRNNAAAHHYDDFHSIHACPKVTLIVELNKVGLTKFAKKVENGDYDA